jgi:hypothetical protein
MKVGKMAILTTVVNVKGEVFSMDAAGVKTRLKDGGMLREGDVLITGAGASADLDLGGGVALAVPEEQTFAIDATIGGPDSPDAADNALSESGAAIGQIIKSLATSYAGAQNEEGEAVSASSGGVFAHLLQLAESMGADTSHWTIGDIGTAGAPAVDVIADFANGTDKLVFKDLLTGDIHDPGNLAQYLHFEYNPIINTTVLNISTKGYAADAAQVDQQIVLANYDITTYGETDAAIIANLLGSKLVIE